MDHRINKILDGIREEFPEASPKEIVSLAMRISIPIFAVTCFPKSVPLKIPDVHYELYDLLEDDSIRKAAIALPRGLAKSTVTSFLYVLWRLLHKPSNKDLFITIISESQSQSINFPYAHQKRSYEKTRKSTRILAISA